MVSLERDTIAAIATAAGPGGVGVVRVSGPAAAEVIGRVVRRSVRALPDRMLVYAVAREADGERIDEVLAVVMRGPRSFTGEDVAEIHGHGGAVNLTRLLRAVIAAGARHAQPGEFTRRAFENGRIDLARAEAVAEVVSASTERAWRAAQWQLGGAIGDAVRAFDGGITELLAEVEASIDFPEEDLDPSGGLQVAARAEKLAHGLEKAASSYEQGRVMMEGVDVALVGAVNAGKSSLFNALIGRERALVDTAPGTTRDFVEARVTWDGIAVAVIDTAGERPASGVVERRGIELGQERAAAAELEIRVVSAEEVRAGAAPEPAEGRRLWVMSKGDLWSGPEPAGWLVTSAVSGTGVEGLRRAVVERALGGAGEPEGRLVVTSERQRDLFAAAGRAARAVAEAVRSGHAPEIIAVELREAQARLAEVLGKEIDDEVLDRIFSRFCIGK